MISRAEVESGDISPAIGVLQRLIESFEIALEFFERVDIAFHGYDDDSRELFGIQKVRDYSHKLDHSFPFWLFFLSKRHLGLQCLFLFPAAALNQGGAVQNFPGAY